MSSRRKFLKLSAMGAGFLVAKRAGAAHFSTLEKKTKPIVISTWSHGLAANATAFQLLSKGDSALDAVERGVMVTESDPEMRSVGYGGLPDREGKVTLDACIMDAESRCGAVAFLQHIKNPIAVARKVMEETPHVMIVGQGALDFALDQGFQKENLLTEKSKEDWQNWMKESQYAPKINVENHDTIGMLALDKNGDLAGACTTSGAAYKYHGRVGDSPIIGAGLFVDNEVGAACATGLGEAVIRVAGSHLVVELMRQGYEPEIACKMAVDRIIRKHKDLTNLQVGFLALRRDGAYGGYSIYNGFNFAVSHKKMHEMVDAPSDRNW